MRLGCGRAEEVLFRGGPNLDDFLGDACACVLGACPFHSLFPVEGSGGDGLPEGEEELIGAFLGPNLEDTRGESCSCVPGSESPSCCPTEQVEVRAFV